MTTPAYVEKAVAILMASYPGAGAKPGMAEFLKLVEQLLSRYHAEVLNDFGHPSRGIAAECKFFPSLAEIKAWCEESANKIWRAREQERSNESRLLYGRAERETELTPGEMAEKRERVATMFRDLVKEFKGIPDPFKTHGEIPLSKAEQKAQAEIWLERHRARAAVEPPPMLSQYARGSLRKPA